LQYVYPFVPAVVPAPLIERFRIVTLSVAAALMTIPCTPLCRIEPRVPWQSIMMDLNEAAGAADAEA
jgi:hypothetical protein